MTAVQSMQARCLRWLGPRRPSARQLQGLLVAMRSAGLGPASINRHFSALRLLHADLPTPWQREPRGRTRTVTPAEAAALAAGIGDPYGSLVTFLAETGLRVGEAWDLTEQDVEGGWVHVRDSKNGDSRRVPLTDLGAQAWLAGPWRRLSRSAFQHAFRKAVVKLGLGDLRPHDLRHSAASRLVDAGVPLPTVSTWLGHRDYRSTLRYTHVSSEGLQKAREMLEGM